jgi:hypothetical protein
VSAAKSRGSSSVTSASHLPRLAQAFHGISVIELHRAQQCKLKSSNQGQRVRSIYKVFNGEESKNYSAIVITISQALISAAESDRERTSWRCLFKKMLNRKVSERLNGE